MKSATDQELLRDYADRRSEAAFAELVRRHVDLVYSAALRMVRDAHLAQDVTQAAFVALAQSAAQLTSRAVLAGWLHRTAQNLAANAVRSETRRRVREQEAAAMNELLAPDTDPLWDQIAPQLDTALGELSEPDRDAVLLRYFERKSAREMAQAFGTSEEAAQRRVSRAVERLREFFARRGVAVGASSLATLVSANAVQAAPAGLATAISTATSVAGAALASTAAATTAKTIAMTTLQKTIIGAALAAGVGTGLYEARQAARLRQEVQTLQQQQAPLAEQVQQLTRQRDSASNKLSQAISALSGRGFHWESVESPDYLQYIANLRAIGCPEETIRDIIRADVHKLYEDKKKQVRQNGPKLQYWRETAQQFIRGRGRETWGQLFALEEQRLALLRRLGIEPDYKMDMVKRANGMDVALDFLPDEKRAEILRLQKALQDRRTMRKDDMDTEVILQLQRELDDGIKRLLTSEEALQYQMRMSLTANQMLPRDESGVFEFTEPEYAAVFKLRKAFDDEYPAAKVFSETEAEKAKRAAAESQVKEQIKQVLGAERYEDYQMVLDHSFEEVLRFTQKAELGSAQAKQLYLLRRQAEERARQLKNDQALTREARAAALAGIRQETERAFQAALGAKGWEQFNQPAYNWWLSGIYRPSTGPTNAAAP